MSLRKVNSVCVLGLGVVISVLSARIWQRDGRSRVTWLLKWWVLVRQWVT